MVRVRRSEAEPEADDSDDDLKLTCGIHARISEDALAILKRMAKNKGLKPSTWIRVELYKALGIIKPERTPRS